MALCHVLFAEDSDIARGKDPDDAGGLCGCVGVVGAVGKAAVDLGAEGELGSEGFDKANAALDAKIDAIKQSMQLG